MQLFEQPIVIDQKWIPAEFQAVEKYHLKLKAGERKIFRKKKPMRCSKWAERYRVVTMSSRPGAWRNATTPYLAGVMDASFFPSVETVIVCAAPQTGKSEAVNNCIGYAVDRRPGSALYIYPDEQTARENSKDRIADMILTSPQLKGYLTGADDDISFYRLNLRHLQIYMGWARSAARLANKPIPYVVFDEIDKYPITAGKKEASPMALGEKRTRTYRGFRKIWKFSSPTIETGPVWTALCTEAQVVFVYLVRCPECTALQYMAFDEKHFKIPEGERDPNVIEAQNLAWYVCDVCGAKWDDDLRDEAVQNGEWRVGSVRDGAVLYQKDERRTSNVQRPTLNEGQKEQEHKGAGMKLEEYLYAYRPKKVGFHIPSWISHFVGLSEVMARFLRGTKDKTALKDFKNSDEAVPWIHYEVLRQEDAILALCDDRPRGRVPGGGVVAGLVAGVDTQDDGFWYRVRAFGFGGAGLVKESWGVREGFVTTFEALEQVLWADKYMDEDGNEYIIRMVIQDALGHRTSEVYTFCLKHRGRIIPSFGRQKMAQAHTWNNLQYFPGGKKPIPGGLRGVNVNTNYYKDELSTLLEISPADPGAWHENAEFSEAYARHMTSEFINDKGVWECPAGKDNHLWDCSVLCLCAHDILGMMFWPAPDGKSPSPAPQRTGRGVRSAGINGEKWLERRKGFVKR